MKPKNVTLEVSLKPFYKKGIASFRETCGVIFEQWKPLVKDAECVSVMLWTSDGSELLDYDGRMDTAFEWAYWVGNANATPQTHASRSDPQGVGLHASPWLYQKEPPVVTYGDLKRLVSTIKEVGAEQIGRAHV